MEEKSGFLPVQERPLPSLCCTPLHVSTALHLSDPLRRPLPPPRPAQPGRPSTGTGPRLPIRAAPASSNCSPQLIGNRGVIVGPTERSHLRPAVLPGVFTQLSPSSSGRLEGALFPSLVPAQGFVWTGSRPRISKAGKVPGPESRHGKETGFGSHRAAPAGAQQDQTARGPQAPQGSQPFSTNCQANLTHTPGWEEDVSKELPEGGGVQS